MPRRLRLPLILLCAWLCISLACCAPSTCATPAELLAAMCEVERPLPAGRVYVRSAPQDSDSHPCDEMLTVTFGNGHFPPEMDQVADVAVYLSFTHPCELAVFRCKTADGTDAVAAMCLRRLDFLRNHRTDQGSEADAYLESACVTVWGRWVIFTVSSDPDAALRAARRAL